MDVNIGIAGENQVKDELAERCQKLFLDFLQEWQDQDGVVDDDEEQGEDRGRKYVRAARALLKPERNTLVVSMKDMEVYKPELANMIVDQYYRIYPHLCIALKKFVKDRSATELGNKDFYVSFIDVDAAFAMRDLSTIKIGHLVRIKGQVVRTHPVHPELVSGTFTCMECQTVISDVVQQFKYTMPSVCRNPVCNNRSRFVLDINKSRFADFQKVRVQEVQSELPRGCIPRSLDVILRAETVETAQPGDISEFIGTLIVVPDVGALSTSGARAESSARQKGEEAEGVRGLKSLGVRDLHYKTAFLACSVSSPREFMGKGRSSSHDVAGDNEVTPQSIKESMSEAEWDVIYKMSRDEKLYQNITDSLFPTIHGSDEVKRGILLMLFGGVGKSTAEGTSLRGDINICVVGDPSTAKSQFLKQVADFSPRAVYTSGKASSAAGLTAAVVKEEESSEFVIEAGAVMLADNGICCIDEFDKMNPGDQVAIHEAMEQQTISIAKAGVKACLNARTSILAAANPASGRYDKTKSLRQNIQMSAPIMSRFDLFFILVDDCNEVTDYAIAKKIVDLHSKQEEFVQRVYQPEDIKRYLTFSRLFKPKISSSSMEFLVEQYRHLRQRDSGGGVKSTYRITVRQLESMIRLSEALARLYCSEEVQPRHVKEAYRLINKSIIRVDQPEVYFDDGEDQDEQREEEENTEMETDEAGDTDVMTRKQVRLSYEEYRKMANLIIWYLRSKDSEAQDKGEDYANIKKKDVINWYLNEILTDIESQDEVVEKRQVVVKVINRLTYQDKVLIPLNKSGLTQKGAESEEVAESDEDSILIVHPNYVSDM